MGTAPAASSYSPAVVMMPGTATMAPMTTTVLPSSQFVGLPSAQSMVAYPSYPGMLPQAYMPTPTMVNMGATTHTTMDAAGQTMTGTAPGTAPAVTGGTSAVPNVGQTATNAAIKLATKKKKVSGDKKKTKK